MTRVVAQGSMKRTRRRQIESIRITKSFGTAVVLAFGFHGLVSGVVGVTSLYASETVTESGHSLMKSDGNRNNEGLATIAGTKPSLKSGMKSDSSNIGKKPRTLIRKPSSGGSQTESPQQADQSRPSSTPLGVDQAQSATKDSESAVARSGAGMSSVVPQALSGSSVATTSPGIPAAAAIAGAVTASPGSSMGAAGSGGSSSGGGRSAQNLLRQMPGLQQLLVTHSGPPPEVIAAPAPPLGPPQAGLPPPPANWPAYHVLNRLAYGGTPNQLNTISHLTPQEAGAWAIRYMKEQLELDPDRPWPTNLHNTNPLPTPIVLDDSALSQRLAADRADWRAEDGLPDVLSPMLSELQDYDLIRKTYSRRQLREKMAYFWVSPAS